MQIKIQISTCQLPILVFPLISAPIPGKIYDLGEFTHQLFYTHLKTFHKRSFVDGMKY